MFNTDGFNYNPVTGEWKNLYTKRDEDVLGYNHLGIRVNPLKGRLYFDKNGMYHEPIMEDDKVVGFSRYGTEFDGGKDSGKDRYGFEANCSSRESINGWHKMKDRSGRTKYVYGEDTLYDYDGYDIAGFDSQGFNRDGVNKQTSMAYNLAGMRYKKVDGRQKESAFPLYLAIQTLKEEDNGTPEQKKMKKMAEIKMIEFCILRAKNKNIEKMDWYKITDAKAGGNIEEECHTYSMLLKRGDIIAEKELKGECVRGEQKVIEAEKERDEAEDSYEIIKIEYDKLLAMINKQWRSKIWHWGR